MPGEKVKSFGEHVPLGRAGQPAELASIYVLLASDDAHRFFVFTRPPCGEGAYRKSR